MLQTIDHTNPSIATGYAHSPGESENPDLWRGLIGAWSTILGKTGNQIKDYSGNNLHATFTSKSLDDWRYDEYGTSLIWDGGYDDYASIGQSLPQLGAQCTFAFWIKRSANDSDLNFLFCQRADFAGYDFQCYLSNGDAVMFQTKTGSGILFGYLLADPRLLEWDHFALVKNSETANDWDGYINGKFITTCGVGNTAPFPDFTVTPTQDFSIGKTVQNHPSLQNAHSQLGDLYIYDRAITATEVKRLAFDRHALFRRKKFFRTFPIAGVPPTPSDTKRFLPLLGVG